MKATPPAAHATHPRRRMPELARTGRMCSGVDASVWGTGVLGSSFWYWSGFCQCRHNSFPSAQMGERTDDSSNGPRSVPWGSRYHHFRSADQLGTTVVGTPAVTPSHPSSMVCRCASVSWNPVRWISSSDCTDGVSASGGCTSHRLRPRKIVGGGSLAAGNAAGPGGGSCGGENRIDARGRPLHSLCHSTPSPTQSRNIQKLTYHRAEGCTRGLRQVARC
jgi:hypothetical protein